jgi:hypothetical protein
MKLMEKDPGADQPIWFGGAASAFVIAAKFMETRAKDEGVWEFWDGMEDSTFYITAPEIEFKYDARFSSGLYDSTSTDGIALAAESRGVQPNPNDQHDVGSPPFQLYSIGQYVTRSDPLRRERAN